MSAVRLIATDLDGTLLLPNATLGERTRRALTHVEAAGITVVPVTARQPIGLRALEVPFRGWALCSNGALGLHLGSGEVLFETLLDAEVQQRLGEALSAVAPEVRLAAVRQQGSVLVAQTGYAALASYDDHKRDPRDMGSHPLGEVLAEPCLKLVIRQPGIAPEETMRLIHGLGLSGFSVTRSGAPFVEVAHPQASKASGVQRLCKHLGISRTEVLAFGDAPNDIELLRWAGRGLAVANAEAEVRRSADAVIADNAAQGVAQELERLVRPEPG